MSPTRIALLGGPVFFALWFVGAQVLYFASGGGVNGATVPNATEYPEAVLSNQSGVNSGSTLLVLAAISLLWFAVGLRNRIRSHDTLDLFPVLAIGGVVLLLILQAGSPFSSGFGSSSPGSSSKKATPSHRLGGPAHITGTTPLSQIAECHCRWW